jgi:hypothetical protein
MKIDTESYDRVVGREKFRTEKEGAKEEGTKMACGKNGMWEKTLVSLITFSSQDLTLSMTVISHFDHEYQT